MSKLLEALENWGCDIKGAMERFLADEELYVTCLETVIMDEAFEKLGVALEQKQIQEAFDYAHTLKGVFANLGLKPMYLSVERLVEPLRAGNGENLETAYKELLEANDYLKQLLGK